MRLKIGNQIYSTVTRITTSIWFYGFLGAVKHLHTDPSPSDKEAAQYNEKKLKKTEKKETCTCGFALAMNDIPEISLAC